VEAALRDHRGYPASICRHEARLATIASIVAEPEAGWVRIAVGNPCAGGYTPYQVDPERA
jgi:hypothetical protein